MSKKNKKINLKTAIAWTENWRSLESDYNKYNECNGFLVPVQDLLGAIKEMEGQKGPQYIRAYMGVEFKTDGDKISSEEKLIIVGTRPETKPSGQGIVYRDILPTSMDVLDNDGDGGSIWDFTTPCPPDCDDESDLN